MPLTHEEIAKRVAMDLPDGCYVNLGVGIPTLVSNYLPSERDILLQSENGILGMGPTPSESELDPDLIHAGKGPVTLLPGAAIFHQADSFAMLRGGHVDFAVIGAYQVSEAGDLANWQLPGAALAGIGGAADIAVGARNVFVAMRHTTKDGQFKIVKQCTYSLTARRVVKRIFTDLAVIEVTQDGLRLLEIAPGASLSEVQAKTEPRLIAASDLREIPLPDRTVQSAAAS